MRIKEGSLYISSKELRDAFPVLHDYYEEVLEGKRPKIEVVTKEEYSFDPAISDAMSDYYVNKYYVFFDSGKVVQTFDAGHASSKPKAIKFHLEPGNAVMVLDYGYYKACTLYVHPDFMNPQLPGGSDLSIIELYALAVVNSISSAYRKEYLDAPQYKTGGGKNVYMSAFKNLQFNIDDMKEEVKTLGAKTWHSAFYDYVFPSLAQEGLVKINAKGSIQITMNGKNQIEQYR